MSATNVNIPTFLSDISEIVGSRYVLNETHAMSEFLEERRGNYFGEADAVVLPATPTAGASIGDIIALS